MSVVFYGNATVVNKFPDGVIPYIIKKNAVKMASIEAVAATKRQVMVVENGERRVIGVSRLEDIPTLPPDAVVSATDYHYWWPPEFIGVKLIDVLAACDADVDGKIQRHEKNNGTVRLRRFKFHYTDDWFMASSPTGVTERWSPCFLREIKLEDGHCYVGVVSGKIIYDVIWDITAGKSLSGDLVFP